MAKRKYAIGVDFGTESGHAVIVDVANGKELATAIYPYKNGVIDERAAGDKHPPRTRLGTAGPRGLHSHFQAHEFPRY